MGAPADGRGLAVLADGVTAAFAAGAVAALARSGRTWNHGLGAGLGAQIAFLALCGEAEEAARRWRRQSEMGCPLLRSRLAAAQESLGPGDGVVLLPDAWRLEGWLDERSLAEHLAPEAADPGGRLRRAGVTLQVAFTDLVAGSSGWLDVHGQSPAEAFARLGAAARFSGGWPPLAIGDESRHQLLCGGVGATTSLQLLQEIDWDVVCGFAVPPAVRPGCGTSIWEQLQRQDELRASQIVKDWSKGAAVQVFAPDEAALRMASQRPDAELGVELPLPWERNRELCGLLVRMGEIRIERH